MELEELYKRQSKIEKKMQDFLDQEGTHTGDPYFQDLLVDLEQVEDEINSYEKK